jgi:Ca-activated chloride channel family protein
MAEAIGWGKKPVGWSDILSLANNPQGWSAYGFPQWGKFKFGHTHPEYSNSGLISLFAEAYAGIDKTAGMTLTDVQNPKTATFLGQIERAVVHYGESTGFFGRKMFGNGPAYLSAAVLYENMVIESYSQKDLPFPVVAIYPKEGTFWSDHPVGVVNRDWVTAEHKEAAEIYMKFLLEKPQQEAAMGYGFRPGILDIPLVSPIDLQHGVNPKEPQTTLEVPSVEVMDSLISLWKQNKKHSHVVLILDTSGSMKGERILNAREGAKQFTNLLGDPDRVSLLPFSTQPHFTLENVSLKQGRAIILASIDSLFVEGGTALYDAISMGYGHLLSNPSEGFISAVVVLTDGEDTQSSIKLNQILEKIRFDSETRTVRVFTIGYGNEADGKILESIANQGQGKFFKGSPENIGSVFKEISTFF